MQPSLHDLAVQNQESPTSCARILKILSDETRLAVVELLLDGPQEVGTMMEQLGVEQSLFSHHLRVLRDAGLVIAERHGKGVRYRLSPDLESVRRGRAINLGCCKLSFS